MKLLYTWDWVQASWWFFRRWEGGKYCFQKCWWLVAIEFSMREVFPLETLLECRLSIKFCCREATITQCWNLVNLHFGKGRGRAVFPVSGRGYSDVQYKNKQKLASVCNVKHCIDLMPAILHGHHRVHLGVAVPECQTNFFIGSVPVQLHRSKVTGLNQFNLLKNFCYFLLSGNNHLLIYHHKVPFLYNSSKQQHKNARKQKAGTTGHCCISAC